MEQAPVLRDYIYLDWERIRSLAAQLLDPAQADYLCAASGSDLRYTSAPSETPSLRQRTAVHVERELISRGGLRLIEAGEELDRTWQFDRFRDGELVLLTGSIRIIDFRTTSQFLEATPEIMKSAFHLSNLPKQEKAAKDPAARRELEQDKVTQQRQINEVKALKSEQFADVIRDLFGESVRIKVRPDPERPVCILVGSCKREHFGDSPVLLMERYGYQIDAGWMVLGQINKTEQPDLASMPTGNSVLDTFESLALHFNSLMRLAAAPQFPAVSFVPLAIYRAPASCAPGESAPGSERPASGA